MKPTIAFQDGEAKTLMFFEGCAPDLGCSLVLQGADGKTLAKVKKIMKYLIYVAYHLKLENKFLMDEFALPPKLDQLVPRKAVKNESNRRAFFKIAEEDDSDVGEEPPSKQEDVLQIESKFSKTKQENIVEESKKFSEILLHVILSSSPFCSYPLPYLLQVDGQTCSCRRFIPDRLYESGLLRSDKTDFGPETANQLDKPKQKTIDPNVILNEPHPFTMPDVVPRLQDHSIKCLVADFRARGGLVDLKIYRDFEELQRRKRKEINVKQRYKIEVMKAGLQNKDVEIDCKDGGKDVALADERDKRVSANYDYYHQ